MKRYRPVTGKNPWAYFLLHFFYLACSVFVGVLLVWVPAQVVSLLSQGSSWLYVLYPVALLTVMSAVKAALAPRIYWLDMVYRAMDIGFATSFQMSLPAAKMDSAKGEKITACIMDNCFMGNEEGTEGLMRSSWNLLEALGSTLCFVFLSIQLPFYWLPLLIFPAVFRGIATIYFNRYREKIREQEISLWKESRYLERMFLRTEAGKDQRLFAMRHYFGQRVQNYLARLFAIVKTIRLRDFGRDAIGVSFSLVRDAICVVLLLQRVAAGESIAYFVLYVGMMLQIGGYVDHCFTNGGEIVRTGRTVSRYREIWREKTYDEGDYALHLPEGEAEIVFDHVSFGYDQAKPVIRDLSLTLKAGSKVALVGENGAGKTTLVKLAAGILMPQQGRILFNGVDLQEVNPRERYERVTMVFQDVLIFAMTVAENVALCEKEKIDEARLRKCLQEAGILADVEALPHGVDTELLTYLHADGVDFSGGQKQRLMLARALYKGGDLIVLDEPTSALDPLAEAALYEEYLTFAAGKTAVFISHRLSSTQFCDRVLFLQRGEIAQDGSHDELMRQPGPYREMFDVQAKYYREEQEGTDKKEVDVYA